MIYESNFTYCQCACLPASEEQESILPTKHAIYIKMFYYLAIKHYSAPIKTNRTFLSPFLMANRHQQSCKCSHVFAISFPPVLSKIEGVTLRLLRRQTSKRPRNLASEMPEANVTAWATPQKSNLHYY